MLSAKPGDGIAGSALRMHIRGKGLFGMLTRLRRESMAPRRFRTACLSGGRTSFTVERVRTTRCNVTLPESAFQVDLCFVRNVSADGTIVQVQADGMPSA